MIVFLVSFIYGCERNGKSIEISNSIYTILRKNDIYNARIDKLGDYSKCKIVSVDEKDITVSKQEIDKYCAVQLESFSEIVPVQDRKVVVEGDVVYITCIIYQDKKVVKQIENDNLVVGSGNYDKEVEKALIGRKIGEAFKISSNIPNLGTCELNITVKSINYFVTYTLTDEFVKEKFNINTVEEYYRYCKKLIQEQKLEEEKLKREKELFLSIIDICKFTIDKNEIAKYSMRYVDESEKLAEIYDLTLEEYVENVLGKSLDKFYQECYNQGEYEVKAYLVVGAVFADLDISITEEQYYQMCESMGLEVNNAKEDAYNDSLVQFCVMKEEILKSYM